MRANMLVIHHIIKVQRPGHAIPKNLSINKEAFLFIINSYSSA